MAQLRVLDGTPAGNAVRTPQAGEQQVPVPVPVPSNYVPPITLVLRGLGISESDLQQPTVSVASSFLRFILGELVRRGPFDPAWYAGRYPDVEGARLSGQLPSLHQHYYTTGYFEARLPCEPAFDPDLYYSLYEDVSRAFSPADSAGLRHHFTTQGWWEGRVGTPELRHEADRWLEASKGGR